MKFICKLSVTLLGPALGIIMMITTAQAKEASLQLCLEGAADTSPVYPTQVFPATTKEVVAVFQLGPGESYKNLIAIWIAVDVGGAVPPNYEIAKASLSLGGKTKGRFRIDQPKPLPVGKYRLNVTADGKMWKSSDFAVAALEKGREVKKPEDLLPLRQGQVWTYAFVQEAGEGVKIKLPGVTPDAEGKLRATVTMTVAGIDPSGTHIEMRRNNQLVFEEWWQLDNRGLIATKRKDKDGVVMLNPSQILWSWPLKAPHEWNYTPEDGSYKQSYRVWGPVPIKTPQGETPGYVVLVEQPSKFATTTVERQFVPGVGLVREVIISALGSDMMSRQEMVLQK